MNKTLVKYILSVFLLVLSTQAIWAQTQTELNDKLLQTAKNNYTDSVKYWLEKGADVNFADENGLGALHYSISSFNNELSKYLIKKGASVNSIDKKYIAPIFSAAINGNLRACYLLHSIGADLNVKDSNNNLVYVYAEKKGFLRVAGFLKNPKTYSDVPTYREYLLQSFKKYEEDSIAEAIVLGEKAKENAFLELSTNHKRKLEIFWYLILLYMENQQLSNCIPFYIQIIQIQKQTYGEANQEYIQTLNRLANMYLILNEYDNAINAYSQALQIGNVFFKEHEEYFLSLIGLANAFFKSGRYDQSLNLYFQALRKIELIKGQNTSDYAIILEKIAKVYYTQYNFEEAITLQIKALKIKEATLGKTHPDYAISLSNLANFGIQTGNYELALKMKLEAYKIREEYTDRYDVTNAFILNDLGHIYTKKKQYSNAIDCKEQALFFMKNLFGENHLNYASILVSIADTYCDLEKFDKAQEYTLNALAIIKNTFGEYHPDIFHYYLKLLLISINQNKSDSALYYSKKTTETLSFNISKEFSYLSDYEREIIWDMNGFIFNLSKSINIAFSNQNPSILTIVYNNEIFSNSLLLNTSRNIQQSILNSKDSSLISSYEEFKNLRRQINYLQQQPVDKQQGLPELEEKANQLDKQLTKASQAYQQNKENLNIQWQDVQNNLKEGEAAVQFISFLYYNKQWTDSTMYCALIVKPEMEYPAMIPLFEEKQLQALLEGQANPNMLYASRGTKVSYASTPAKSNGDELYRLIWQPLQSELNEVQTVYFAPSGLLHKVSFSALPVDSTKLLCDQFSLHRLSSTRNIAVQEIYEEEPVTKQIALFGGIDYDLSNQSWSDNELALTHTESILSRGFSPDSSQRSITFNYLDGTKQEVENIASIVKRNNEFELQYYTADKATEEAFKKLSNQNINLIHIATHGFFFPPEHQEDMRRPELQTLGEQRFRYVPNPLLRSGLLMAGANRTWKGDYPKDSLEDGVLTAQEISEMNLLNTELVVLSACETGLGDINNSEGVFGLQRAFKLAGIKTLIMSLWKVPDKQTSMLMQAFYTNWFGGMSKHEAFKKAQLSVRETHPEPYYWAGFVMVD